VRVVVNGLTLLSLALCAAAVGLWVRSYVVYDSWNWGTATGRAGFDSIYGRLTVGRVDVPPAAMAGIPRGRYFKSAPADPAALSSMLKPSRSFAGFQVTVVNAGGMTARDVRIPYWSLVLAAAVLPAVRAARRAFRRPPPGLCRRCGYDLTGNVSGRCPECGTAVAKSTGR
jgi:hypothetical protein